jgi:hypothetical protein
MEYRFKVGDRVMGTKDALSHRVGTLGRVTRLQGKSSVFVLWDGDVGQYHFAHKNEIVRIEEEPMYNVTQEPKLWRDMTPEEKGALLLAEHEGKAIEEFGTAYPDAWYETDPYWDNGCAYRIKPEPKRKTVTAKLCIDAHGTSLHMRPDYRDNYYGDDNFYFTLTFDTIDGKPDLSSIKIEDT